MTLETLITILNLNNCFKDSDESVKVTAINQVLNDLEVDNLMNGVSAGSYSKQVEIYETSTYRYLNKILGLNLREEEVLALFQYSMNDFTNDNPLTCTFDDPLISKIFGLDYSVQFRNSLNLEEIGFAIIPLTKSTYRIQPCEEHEEIFKLNYSPMFKTDRVQVPTTNTIFDLNYNPQFKVTDLSQVITFDLDYSPTYITF